MESSGDSWIRWISFSSVPMATASPMQASALAAASEADNPRDFIFLNPVLYMGTQFLADGRAQGLVGNLVGYFIQESFLIQKNTSHHLVDSGFIDPPFLFFFN